MAVKNTCRLLLSIGIMLLLLIVAVKFLPIPISSRIFKSLNPNIFHKVTMVTDAYIFAGTQEKDFAGEGFFITLTNGKDLFIYSHPEDNPHDLANTARKFLAIAKGKSLFRYSNPKNTVVYLTSKYDLGMENRFLPSVVYYSLIEQTRDRGLYKKVSAVYYKNLDFTESELRVSSQEIVGISKITTTTGGSVFLFSIDFKNEKPLSIVISTQIPDAKIRLEDLMQEINKLVGSDRMIVAKNVQYQNEIYTWEGVRSGWTAYIDNVSIK